MNGLLEDPVSVDALVQDDQVHRDVYIDPRVFQLEMQRLWSRAWLYVGHESQVPAAGDYLTTTLATEPVILVRCQDVALAVLRNRWAHKGARLVRRPQHARLAGAGTALALTRRALAPDAVAGPRQQLADGGFAGGVRACGHGADYLLR